MPISIGLAPNKTLAKIASKNGAGRADVFANAIKHDHKSPNPTTRWADIIKLK
jgi:nucleotidyltransferase/DNA polymerase involved in DNA repair